jgi:hypothetical protein
MRGVTTMRYVLILTAIAVGVYARYATYRMLDSNNIGSLVSDVDSSLTPAQGGAAQATPIPSQLP